MGEKRDLSAFKNNGPIISIIISEMEVRICVFYSMNCCKKMFDNHENGDDYRLAFSKVVFYMFQQTNNNNSNSISEQDFINATDDKLLIVLNAILEQDNDLRMEYNNLQADNVFEGFYQANKAVIKRTIAFENIPQVQLPEISSDITNIFKSVFDMQTFISPLQNLRVAINDKLKQTLQTLFLQVLEAVKPLIESLDYSFLEYYKEWGEQRNTLLKYGWVYSNRLPDELVDYIHHRQGALSIDEVDKLIVNYFRKDRCKELKNIVNGWSDLPYFHCRTKVFHEALVNHSRKYYNSSVTLLTVHTEGVITDFVRISLKNPRFKVEMAIEDVKKELDESYELSIYEYEVYKDVIEQISARFNENFKPSNPDITSNKSRHKIAHGHAYEPENEVNSLKCFLCLNEIYSIFLMLHKQE